jgi:putative ABC transport system ATP-binding protein
VSLSVERGRFVAIMGASGSGKSTLLHLLGGLTRPDAGKVLIEGQDIAAMSDRELTLFRRKEIGLIFQTFNLIPTLTAAENIALPLQLAGQNGADLKDKVQSAMQRLNIAHRRDHRPDAMSGGEQQRVAIGRALVGEPAVILADEPTGNLDSANSRATCELLRELCQQDGATIVMVTHELSVAVYAEQIVFIRDGRIADSARTADIGDAADLANYYQSILSGPAVRS